MSSPFANKRDINLDITNKCTLACLRCTRALFDYEDKKVPGDHMSIDDFLKVIDRFDHIQFCGNVSDPTLHPDLPNFLRLVRSRKKSCSLSVAASHRPESWFKEAFEANPDAEWVFGIDGLPETSSNYRKRQDGVKLFNVMLLAKSILNKVIWQYIIFSYNENDMIKAKRIAEEHNITISFIKSSRFFKDDPLRPSEGYYLPRAGFDKAIRQRYENKA